VQEKKKKIYDHLSAQAKLHTYVVVHTTNVITYDAYDAKFKDANTTTKNPKKTNK